MRTATAVRNLGRFSRGVRVTAIQAEMMKKAAADANIPVSQMLRIMEHSRGVTQAQRNIRIATSAIRTMTGAVREARMVYTAFFGTASRSPRTRGLRGLSNRLRDVKKQAGEATHSLRGLSLAVAGGFGLGGTLGAIGGMQALVRSSISASMQAENAAVTFDTLLGNQTKSADLFRRITDFSAKTPFVRTDIVEASKRLLNITRDNVDENEKLYKLASSVAALRPGSKVADVAQGFVNATVGEFEIMKSFGIVLRADQFKSAGTPGGKAYAEAVIKEIERQFKDKTGGRDLVAALSETFAGKVSTITDNVEMFTADIGRAIINNFELKPLLDDIGWFTDQFAAAFNALMTGKALEPGAVDGTILNIASVVVQGFNSISEVFKTFLNWGKAIMSWFSGLDSTTQKTILKIGAIGSAVLSFAGVLLPALGAVGAVLSFLGGGLVVAAKGVLFGIVTALASVAAFAVPVALAVGAAVIAFGVLRNDGESVIETLTRIGKTIFDKVVGAFNAVKLVVSIAWNYIKPALVSAMTTIKEAINDLRTPMREVFGMFGDASPTFMDLFFIGQDLGRVLAKVITKSADLAAKSIKAFAGFIKRMQPIIKHVASDLTEVGKAIWGIMSGAEGRKAAMKTFFLGLADLITMPFRMALAWMIGKISSTILSIADRIRPFSKTIGDQVAGMAVGLDKAREKVLEGFLPTKEYGSKFQIEVGGTVKAETPVEIKVDGEKVAETTVTTEMRARNSGRGGDPVTPDEMGFVLEGGGSKIRVVGLGDVMGDI